MALQLVRKIGEKIVINDNIILTVTEINQYRVKLAFSFPSDATVYREEIYDKMRNEKHEQ